MNIRQILVAATLAGVFLAALGGCGVVGSKVSKSNYDKITIGMTQAQVEEILGPGTEVRGVGITGSNVGGSTKAFTWKDGDKFITINFANDQVSAKFEFGL